MKNILIVASSFLLTSFYFSDSFFSLLSFKVSDYFSSS
jgi:hypothetical protein